MSGESNGRFCSASYLSTISILSCCVSMHYICCQFMFCLFACCLELKCPGFRVLGSAPVGSTTGAHFAKVQMVPDRVLCFSRMSSLCRNTFGPFYLSHTNYCLSSNPFHKHQRSHPLSPLLDYRVCLTDCGGHWEFWPYPWDTLGPSSKRRPLMEAEAFIFTPRFLWRQSRHLW